MAAYCHHSVCLSVTLRHCDLTAPPKMTKLGTKIHMYTRNFPRKLDSLLHPFPNYWNTPKRQNAYWSTLTEGLNVARPNLAGRLAVIKRTLPGSLTPSLHPSPNYGATAKSDTYAPCVNDWTYRNTKASRRLGSDRPNVFMDHGPFLHTLSRPTIWRRPKMGL